MIIKIEIEEALKREKESKDVKTLTEDFKKWDKFLREKIKEGKYETFKEESNMLIELEEILLKKRDLIEKERIEESKRNAEDYEDQVEPIRLTPKQKKEIKDIQKEALRRMTLIEIKDCWERKQREPGLGLRPLSEVYYDFSKKRFPSKDTIKVWLKRAEEDPEVRNIKIIHPEGEHIDDGGTHTCILFQTTDPDIKKKDRLISHSLGVRKEDFEKWRYHKQEDFPDSYLIQLS